MMVKKLASLLVLGVIGVASSLAVEPVPEYAQLLRQAERFRPASTDFRWQQIPWHTDAEAALKQANEEKRPLFVWLAGGRDRDGTPLERC